MIHVISLGAGVQSSVMALMAAAGEIEPMPALAVFADTQAEPQAVYDWLAWLKGQLPFPVEEVTAGSLQKRVLDMRITEDGRAYSKTDIPFHTKSADGRRSMIRQRGCTADYKIRPVLRHIKAFAKVRHKEPDAQVTQWIGISLDEAHRMKPARERWLQNRWPLIEKRMTRGDCLAWMSARGFPLPPRSACVFCPFKSDAEWAELQSTAPDEFARAVKFEKDIQVKKSMRGFLDTVVYIHRSCTPLDKVQFSNWDQIDLFGNECEGMCGL